MVRLLPALALLAACGAPVPEAPLATTDWVVRASLDLRGVRPSLDEIRQVHTDPASAEALVVGFADDPRFPSRVADLYAELLLTRTERWPVPLEAYGLGGGVRTSDYVTSIGDEPLQIIRRIAEDDLPWTETVLGDWTMGNEVLAAIWPMTLEAGDDPWRVAHYTDGRPHAGLLSSNAMWWRYGSTPSNANRGRAAQVTRLFLCVDYSEVTIPFDADLDLLDEAAVEDAIRTDARCTSCHDTLDPVASYLYGFWYVQPGSALDASAYHPERELQYRQTTGLDPAVADTTGYSLRDLGRQIALDPRFPDCAVQQWWQVLLRRKPAADDATDRGRVRDAFLRGDLTVRSLAKALVTTPTYRSSVATANGRKLADPQLLASQIEDLTGFRFVDSAGWDVITADLAGLRGLAGGADGTTSTANADLPNATVVLVQERLAEAAAFHVIRHDAEAAPGDTRLFDHTALAGVDRAAMATQLVDLHARIFGRAVAPDGPEVTANLELWDALLDLEQDPPRAWAGVLTALLRDPDLLLY